jgi:hypothetical protein
MSALGVASLARLERSVSCDFTPNRLNFAHDQAPVAGGHGESVEDQTQVTVLRGEKFRLAVRNWKPHQIIRGPTEGLGGGLPSLTLRGNAMITEHIARVAR